MLKKEILDTLKQTGFVMSFLLLVPIIFWINTYRLEDNLPFLHYAGAGMILALFMLMLTLAYMMFSKEDSDNAAEYLESLPFSRWKLLLIKVLPRVAIIWIFTFAYCLFIWFPPDQIASSDNFFNTGFRIGEIVAFSAIAVIAMMAGFFLGISDRKNPVLGAAFLLIVLYPLVPGPLLAISLFNHVLVNYPKDALFVLLSLGATILLVPSLTLLVPLSVYRTGGCISGKMIRSRMLKRMAVPTMLTATLWGIALTQM